VNRSRVISSLLLVAGLVFAFLGQLYFTHRREYWRDGIFFWGVSLILFWLLRRRLRWRRPRRSGHARQEFLQQALAWVRWNPWRALAFIGGMGLSLLAGWRALNMEPGSSFAGVLWMWGIGTIWFLMSFVPDVPVRQALINLGRRFCRLRLELTGLAVLLLVALLVRVVDLEHIPANLGGDEGTQGLASLELVEAPLDNPFSTGWYSVPTLSFFAYGLTMQLFGATITGLRMLSVLIGVATVLSTFLLGRELWGRKIGWSAAVVLACSHYHLHFSRLGSNQIGDGLFVTLALWLFVRGVRLRRSIHFALTGVVVGLGWYAYFGARLVGIIVVIYFVWLFLTEYRIQSLTMFGARYGHLMLILLLAALVTTAPLLLHYAAYPDQLTARPGQVGILSADWWAREREYTGSSAIVIFLRQVWRSVSAFHYTLDPTYWYRPSIPLLDPLSGVLFLFGLVWAFVRWRELGSGLLLIWFWLALILGWILTENPPSSQRMVIVTPALALFVSVGLSWLMELGQRLLGGIKFLGWDEIALVALALISILDLHYYFIVYTPSGVYGNPTAEVATRLGRYLWKQDDGYDLYFHGSPTMYADIGNLAFLVRDTSIVDVLQGEGPVVNASASGGVRFVFLPHRLGELDAVRERFPGGEEKQVYSTFDNRLLYVLYEVPAP
jgi:4-amino-4-deoxy-L-arabinose transferase-like glycosyltransferase